MKISIVTINRNNALGLEKTLASIAEQIPNLPADTQLEHIIVDGESDDDSLSKLNPALHSHVISLPPGGIYDALNHGIGAATGDIVGILHSGDVFASSEALGLVVKTFRETDGVKYVYGDVLIGRRLYSGEGFTLKTAVTGFAPPHPSLYATRDVFELVGPYDATFSLAADFEFFLRLVKRPELKGRYIDLIIARMECGGASQKIINRLWRNNSQRLKALRKNGLSASYYNILKHYKYVLKGFICSSKNQRP